MNKVILERAIDQVKSLVAPLEGICGICQKNKSEIPSQEEIDIIDMPTQVGVPTCRTCFDNIRIAIGEISQEY